MQTFWDWMAIAIFAAIVVIFLQRSIGPRPDGDRIINYLPPALGCATGNYVGNEGYAPIAIVLLTSTVAYIWFALKPFR